MIGLSLGRGWTLTTGTTSSLALMLVDGELEIDFDLNCSAGPSTVTYFIEYSEDLITWYAEVAEEDAGKGVISMPKVVRTLADENSTTIADNPSFRASCQFKRQAPFARVQMSAAAGTVVVNSIVAPFGQGPYGTNAVVAAPAPPGCAPIDLHADGTHGSFTLAGASVDPIILATFSYDFTCSNDGHVRLDATVDSAYVSGGSNIFPKYGIFIVSVIPPASELFSLILPDVEMVTHVPVDTLFHTFTDTNTIVNPAGTRFVIFAVAPDSVTTQGLSPANYQYENYILDVTGV